MFNIFKITKKKKITLPNRNLNDIKNVCKVLFIDDIKFETADRLKKEDGWKNTQRIKDVSSLDQTEIIEAHIIFVDVQGVGKKLFPGEEGLGLIRALKKKYPEKKIIMYSAESKGKIDAFHDSIKMVDSILKKNSDHYEFQSTLERLANETFSLSNCIERIKNTLYDQYGLSYTTTEIEEKLSNIEDGKNFESSISKIFKLENAKYIIDIVKLFIEVNNG